MGIKERSKVVSDGKMYAILLLRFDVFSYPENDNFLY